MILRVRGSSWELKIEPKRPREEIKSSNENDRNRRDQKTSIERQIKAPRTMFLTSNEKCRSGPAECAGPLGRIIGGVRRDKKIN